MQLARSLARLQEGVARLATFDRAREDASSPKTPRIVQPAEFRVVEPEWAILPWHRDWLAGFERKQLAVHAEDLHGWRLPLSRPDGEVARIVLNRQAGLPIWKLLDLE